MEIINKTISDWFDKYFEVVSKMAEIESVPSLAKFFTEDVEFHYFTPPPVAVCFPQADREKLLSTFIHPGIHEFIKPQYYLIDLQKMIVAVRLYDQIISDTAGIIAKFNGICIYYIVPDDNMGIKIKKMEFFTENQTPESIEIQNAEFAKSRPGAFDHIISEWLKSKY
jgi:hypothetical protein